MTYHAMNDAQHVAGAFVNPGEGAVGGTDWRHACFNMVAFCGYLEDAIGAGIAASREQAKERGELYWCDRREDIDADGRYGFEIRGGPSDISIVFMMPGLPLEQVRYTGADGQNPWNFPRLLLYHPSAPGWPDSWLWCYMLSAVQERIEKFA